VIHRLPRDVASAFSIERGLLGRDPDPANPPTKRPLVSLMKQARAFGAGVLQGAGQKPVKSALLRLTW
jgi:hypothetical protein